MPYWDGDITDHIIHNYVLTEAGNWTNERIEEYLEYIYF